MWKTIVGFLCVCTSSGLSPDRWRTSKGKDSQWLPFFIKKHVDNILLHPLVKLSRTWSKKYRYLSYLYFHIRNKSYEYIIFPPIDNIIKSQLSKYLFSIFKKRHVIYWRRWWWSSICVCFYWIHCYCNTCVAFIPCE